MKNLNTVASGIKFNLLRVPSGKHGSNIQIKEIQPRATRRLH